MNPIISIIIPTFNSELSISTTLSSLLVQTFESFEVLIIDGDSADHTVEIVQDFVNKDSRFKYLSEKDAGIYDAMNKGINKSRGNWLYFLGSDDYLYNVEVLANINAVIAAYPKSRFIYGDVFTSENYIQRYNNYSYYRLLEVCICHQAIFYHRSLFNKNRYDLKYEICADWDFNLKVFKKSNYPAYADITIAYYNLDGKSAHWYNHPEYLGHFSNKQKLVLRYKGILTFIYYFLLKLMRILKYIFKKS